MASQAGVDTPVTDMEFESPCLEKKGKKDAMNVSAEQEKAEAENVKKKVSDLVAAGDERRDAVVSISLDDISVKDLTVEDSNRKECAFHEKKARDHEGCHLGGGSFGEVYKAVHTVYGEVAVKLAKPGKEDRLMYQKEAGKHVIALTSPHIVSIKGFVECDDDKCNCGLIGIVMEYMVGGSLWDFRINKWKDDPVLWPHTNRMVYEISSGMLFLHSKEIIHRDLKLENVLVDAHLEVKIADLGLATNLRTSSGDKCWGTDSHKPPEAFRTDIPNSTIEKVVTKKYDVYSFAMTLYELLTGIHPYSDRGFDMLRVLKVEAKQTPCLTPVPKNTHEDLKSVMVKSWSYEPNLRPDFTDILKKWLGNLDTRPSYKSLGQYFEQPRSSKKGGETAPKVPKVPKPALPLDTGNESVRNGIENLTIIDHASSQQSESSTAKPVTETVTQSLIEGQHICPTGPVGAQPVDIGTGRSPNPATATVKQGIPESLSQSGSAICGPKNGDIWPVSQEVASHQESSKSGSYGCLKSQFSGPENGCHDNNTQPPVGAGQSMELTGLVSAHAEDPSGPSASQPLKSYMEHNKEQRRGQEPQHGHIQQGAYSHNFQTPSQSEHRQPHPYGDNKPVHEYGDRRPVPVDSSHGRTEYAVGHKEGGPIHQESPPVAPSQTSIPPSSTERDLTIIFDPSPPSDEDFEIKLYVNLSVPARPTIRSKLGQIFSSLERCKHRYYWESNSSLPTMFSFSDITLLTLQLPSTIDEDEFTLYLRVCNKRDLEKLHSLSEKGSLCEGLYNIFVDHELKNICHPVKPSLKIKAWKDQYDRCKAHFEKEGKADDVNKSKSEQSKSHRQPEKNKSGASVTPTNPGPSFTPTNPGPSFAQTNCSGATQINTGKVSITMHSAPNNMVIGDQHITHTHYHGSKWGGRGAEEGGAAAQFSSCQPQKKPEKIKLCESKEKVNGILLLDISSFISERNVKSLGRRLGLTEVEVDNIVYSHRHERSEEIAYQVLNAWLQRSGHDATKAVLAKALLDAQCYDAARNVR